MAFKMNSPLPMFGDPGKIGKNKNKEKEENVLDAINKVSMQSKKFTPRSKETTVKKETSKNSRANIKARKEADKAAGVSKSQMRANKAKSKSEAALEKAKKAKNPSYKAQLKRKADRLAARAKRKGGSPVKAVGDPRNPKTEKKQHYSGYKPLGDADKMKGNSAEAQALNTINTRAQNKIKSEHKKKDLSLKFPTKGQRIGRKGYEIVGSNSTSGNVYVRKPGKLPVMEITRKNLASNIKSKGMVKLNYQKMKHGYNSAGDIIKRK